MARNAKGELVITPEDYPAWDALIAGALRAEPKPVPEPVPVRKGARSK